MVNVCVLFGNSCISMSKANLFLFMVMCDVQQLLEQVAARYIVAEWMNE
jgi:hypothetical protein